MFPGLVVLAAAWAVSPALGDEVLPPPSGEAIDFDRHVQPIFAENCTQCHGDRKQKGNLRLDTAEGVLRGGDSGEPLYLPGDSAGSHLIRLVARVDPDEVMPPEGKGDPLHPDDIGILRAWIDQGAKLPVNPDAVAELGLETDHWSFQPVVRPEVPVADDPWVATPIDGFVLEGLRARGLTPSEPADRATLARRLHLVMHGMPPAPEVVEAFVADESPDAWERLVDQVLASPRYGERWARHWLDIVRFAETNGFETNRERLNAWHFRDYVIAAFNEDKPYDQFIREQIAGDALGVPVGTGFLVAGPYDIVKSPDINLTLMQRQDELADMVNTTGTAFLGLTMGCARCHNHKFDPIPQKDYYAMQAVFAGVQHGERPIPMAPEDEAARRAEIARLQAEIGDLEGRVAPFRRIAARAALGEEAAPLRPAVAATGNTEHFDPVEAGFVRFTIRATNSSQPCIDELEVFDVDGVNVALAEHGTAPSASGTLPGYEQHKLEHINDGRFGNGRSWISSEVGRGWVQLAFSGPRRIARIAWARDREGRFADRVATDYTIEVSVDGAEWRTVASSADRHPFGGETDPRAFLASLPENDAATARGLLDTIDARRREIDRLQTTPAAWIGTFQQPETTHRLYRGDPMAPREPVAPDAIEVIGSLGMALDAPEQERRVALADWIADDSNPLTARVMVNRIWQYQFGTGIVDTPSDFGGNGTPPSHPELLDWLASEFVRGGWSIKHLQKVILMSSSWRQTSAPREAAAAIDADARLLWRFPPRRLSAEAIRDSILAVSGALDLEMGGPGFYLHEVDRENVVHYFAKDEPGPDTWRRMVYLFKIRQEQDGVFGSFDCPDGNQVIPERSRSTTPLQALNLFNSPFLMGQADLFAKRLAKEAGPAVEPRITRAFELLYGRAPGPAELDDAAAFLEEHGEQAFCRAMLNTNEFLFVF